MFVTLTCQWLVKLNCFRIFLVLVGQLVLLVAPLDTCFSLIRLESVREFKLLNFIPFMQESLEKHWLLILLVILLRWHMSVSYFY